MSLTTTSKGFYNYRHIEYPIDEVIQMRKIMIISLAIILIVFSGCESGKNTTTTTIRQGDYCTDNSECETGGCSSQLCVRKTGNVSGGLFTTCEYKAEYQCLKETSCECISNKCQWKQTESYVNCMKNVPELK